MRTGCAAETMMVASLEELFRERDWMLLLTTVLAEVVADPEEKKVSVTGGETGFQLAEKGIS